MKKRDSFPVVTKIVGMIITAWTVFLIALELIRDLEEGIENLFNNFITNEYTLTYPYIPHIMILIYLVGYATVWWKKLWGSVIITVACIFGIVYAESGDDQFHFLLTLLVGFLYFVNWNDERKRKKDP